MTKPELRYNSKDETGNIFWIIRQTMRLMRENGRIDQFEELWSRIQKAASYEEALAVIGTEVTLIDTAE